MVALCSRHHLHTGLQPALVCKDRFFMFSIPPPPADPFSGLELVWKPRISRYFSFWPTRRRGGYISGHLPPHIDPTDAPTEGAAVIPASLEGPRAPHIQCPKRYLSSLASMVSDWPPARRTGVVESAPSRPPAPWPAVEHLGVVSPKHRLGGTACSHRPHI